MLYLNQTFHQYSDKEIIEGCMKGDAVFQRALYDKFSSKMFAVCLRYTNEHNRAQDVLQDSFVKVFKNLDKFRSDGSFEGWIRRIVVNTCIEAFRKQVNMYAVQDTEGIQLEAVDVNAYEQLKETDILKMIQTLSQGYRTVFNLYVIEGYSHKEIADMLNITEGTSKSQLARARYILQQMILGKDKQSAVNQ